MTPPKVIRLVSVPKHIANLAFPTSGILDSIVDLGTTVQAVSPDDIYPSLGNTDPNNPASLLFTSSAINGFTQAVAQLRAPQLAARLDSAIASRENSYYQKYQNQSSIAEKLSSVYAGDEFTPGKINRLTNLQLLSNIQRDALDAHYAQTGQGQASPRSTAFWWVDEGSGDHQVIDQAQNGGTIGANTKSFDPNGSTLGTTTETQTVGTTVPLWPNRIPMLENYAVNQRAQISLADQIAACEIQTLAAPNLDQIFTNELKMIDLGVRQLQLAYLDTLLFSPIDGVVTAISQTAGGAVSAGQTVIRVEKNDTIYIAGRVSTRSPINLGQQATVGTTAQFGDPTQQVSITGIVRAAEGRGAEDQFDIVIECSNISPTGGPIIPPRYTFAYDTATIAFA